MEYPAVNNLEAQRTQAQTIFDAARQTLTDLTEPIDIDRRVAGQKQWLIDENNETGITSVGVAIYDEDHIGDFEGPIGMIVRDPGPFIGHVEFERTTRHRTRLEGAVYFRPQKLPILVLGAAFNPTERLGEESQRCAELMTELGLASVWLEALYAPHPHPSLERVVSGTEATGLLEFLGRFAVTS